MIVYVDEKRCNLCGTCVTVCPSNAIVLADTAIIDTEKCTACERCIDVCPQSAILTVSESGDAPEAAPSAVARTADGSVTTCRPQSALIRALPWVASAIAVAGKTLIPRLAAACINRWSRPSDKPTVARGRGIMRSIGSTAGRRRRNRGRHYRG